MAALLFTLLFVAICAINCGPVVETTRDFRPNGTSLNNCLLKVHTDCQAAYDEGWLESGLYTISPNGTKHIDVFCEQTLDGGWTVFQKRVDGSEDFYRDWDDYKNGFGDFKGEFWIGNDILHYLTSRNDKMLKLELRDGNDIAFAYYSSFMVDPESSNYTLHVSGFSDVSDAGDSLTIHNGYPFSTRDRDNDPWSSKHCAQATSGAWWYHYCFRSNLNGLYDTTGRRGITWPSWRSDTVLSAVKMMLKPR